jgi:hypothetical protein
MTQKLKKNTAEKKKILIKNYNLPIPRPPERTSKLQKKPSDLKRGHPTLFYFCGSFLPSWIRIRIQIPNPDPDPLTRLNLDPIRIRMRSNPAGH